MSKLNQLLKSAKPYQIVHVAPEDKVKLRAIHIRSNTADSARERRLAREEAREFMLTLNPNAVLYEGTMYNGVVYYSTIQDQLDLLNSGM